MTVGELEELLALLPADMAVTIAADGLCRHVAAVEKHNRSIPRYRYMWPKRLALVGEHLPPKLVLRSHAGTPLWCEAFADEVPFEVTGTWPGKPQRRRRR